MLIQEIASQLNDASHRVRLACQDLNLEISTQDTVEVDDNILEQIKSNVEEQRKNWEVKKNGGILSGRS